MDVQTWIETRLQSYGLSTSESAYVLARVQQDPVFQWSGGLWVIDMTTLDSLTLALIWKIVACETIRLIDTKEPNHWTRPLFASMC